MVSEEGRLGRKWKGVLALVLMMLLAGCVPDYPPRPTVCVSCHHGIEAAAAGADNDTDKSQLNVTHSELDIAVREDGTARWTIRSNLSGAGVQSLQSDATAVDRLANRAVTDSVGMPSPYVSIHGGKVSNRSARLTGTTLRMSFTVQDFAEQPTDGIYLVDYFHTEGDTPPAYRLGTDRVVVRGPAGTMVTRGSSNANLTADRRGLSWAGRDTRISSDTYLAFGPDRNQLTRYETGAVVSATVLGWGLPKALPPSLFFIILFVGLLIGMSLVVGKSPAPSAESTSSLKGRLVNATDVILVGIGFAIAVITISLGTPEVGVLRLYKGVVISPIFAAFLMALYGYMGGAGRRSSRAILLAFVGLPIVRALHEVTKVPTSSLDAGGTVGVEMVLWTLVVCIIGIPLFVGGYYARPPD